MNALGATETEVARAGLRPAMGGWSAVGAVLCGVVGFGLWVFVLAVLAEVVW